MTAAQEDKAQTAGKGKLVAKYILLGLGTIAPLFGSLWLMFKVLNLSIIEDGVYPAGVVLLGLILFLLHNVAGTILLGVMLGTFWTWILDIPGKRDG